MLLFSAGEALAHPDHPAGGRLSATLSHLLSEPDHLAMILAPLVVGLAWGALRGMAIRKRRRESVPGYRSSRVWKMRRM